MSKVRNDIYLCTEKKNLSKRVKSGWRFFQNYRGDLIIITKKDQRKNGWENLPIRCKLCGEIDKKLERRRLFTH